MSAFEGLCACPTPFDLSLDDLKFIDRVSSGEKIFWASTRSVFELTGSFCSSQQNSWCVGSGPSS